MLGRETSSARIELRSLEDEDAGVVREYQNGECLLEISELLDSDLPWAPMSKDQVKEKLGEMNKEDRTAISGVWSEEGLIGLAYFSADWDTLCPFISVIIWPEHRRKGYGTEAAKLLLDLCFNNYFAHVVGSSVPDFSEEGLAFAKSLGFKRQGLRRRAGMFNGRFYDSVFLDVLRSEYSGGA